MARPTLAQVAPDGEWVTARTAHFRVTYPVGLDALGRRAGEAAERAYANLAERLGAPPDGTIELLLTDNIDTTNGFATPAPYPRITMYAQAPFDDLELAAYDDWFDILITHELAHVFHLDATGPLGGALRRVFGRVPMGWPLYPHVTTPTWTSEGLAVYYESALTGSGRLTGSATDMVVRTAALEDAFPDLGFASGDPVRWPAGTTRYAFGGTFLADLVADRGEESLRTYVREGTRGLPFRLNAASERAMGTSFSAAWGRWRERTIARFRQEDAERLAASPAPEGARVPERLAAGGWFALYPRHAPDGRRIAYVRYDGRSDLQLILIDAMTGAVTSGGRLPRLGIPSWRDSGQLVVGGSRPQGPYRLTADLWLADTAGAAHPFTDGARVVQPDVAKDGTWAVAVQTTGGTNRLVTVDLSTQAVTPLTPFDPDVNWAFPRVAPDGERIAASRWSGGGFDLVILDRANEGMRTVVADGARNLAPAWTPDGRWLVYGSDRTGIANLYAVSLDAAVPGDPAGAVRQITDVAGGAFYPDVAPDASAIVFVGYHHDGYAIERIAFDPSRWFAPRPPREGAPWPTGPGPGPDSPQRDASSGDTGLEDWTPRPFSSWATLKPRYWLPVIEPGEKVLGQDVIGVKLGGQIAAQDLIGRQAYAAAASVDVRHGRLDAIALYQNAALGRPVLGAAVEQRWDFEGLALAAREASPPDTFFVVDRERTLTASASFPLRGPFWAAAVAAGGGVIAEHRALFDTNLEESATVRLDDPTTILPEVFALARFSNARGFPLSVSAERGVSAVVRGEWRFDAGDSDRARRESTAQVAGYRALWRPWGHARHVLAVRGSGGVVRGPGAGGGHFALGGVAGGGLSGPGFELVAASRPEFPVRGYDRGERRGTRAWSASAEYRFPLGLPQKGRGLLPAFLGQVSGDVFLDVGDAWNDTGGDEGSEPGLEPLMAAGAEALFDTLLFYRAQITLRLGVAQALVAPTGTTVYLTLGRAF